MINLSFSSDNKRNILNINNIYLLPLICYEIIYSGEIKNNDDFDILLKKQDISIKDIEEYKREFSKCKNYHDEILKK